MRPDLEKVRKEAREDIQQLSQGLTADKLWEILTINPKTGKKAGFSEVGLSENDFNEFKELFSRLGDNEREVYQMELLIARAAMLIALTKRQSPAVILGELAGEMLHSEMATLAEHMLNAGNN